MHKRFTFGTVVGMVVGTFAALLTVTAPVGAAGSNDTLEIGVITSLTGRFASFGEMQIAGYEVALKQINDAGGVRGKQLKLIIEDDASSQNAALSAAESLIHEGVPLILGTYSSGISKPLSGYTARQEMPLIVAGSADDSITRPGFPWVFRAKTNATSYAMSLFDLADQLGGMETVAIIHGSGAFETSVADAAERAAKQRGYTVFGRETYDRGLTDFRPILRKFRADNPDVLFMVSYEEDSTALMRQAKEVGLTPEMFAGGAAGFALESFIEGAGDASEYVFSATSWTKDVTYPGAAELYEKLVEALGGEEPSYHAAETYMALTVAADALNRADSLESDDVRQALLETDIVTAAGPVHFENFDGFQNQNPLTMVVMQVQDGQFVTVYPEEIAQGEPRFPTPIWDERD